MSFWEIGVLRVCIEGIGMPEKKVGERVARECLPQIRRMSLIRPVTDGLRVDDSSTDTVFGGDAGVVWLAGKCALFCFGELVHFGRALKLLVCLISEKRKGG